MRRGAGGEQRREGKSPGYRAAMVWIANLRHAVRFLAHINTKPDSINYLKRN